MPETALAAEPDPAAPVPASSATATATAEPEPEPAALLAFAHAAAADPEVLARLPLHPSERTWVRLEGPGGSEAWIIGWPPGTDTGWHDHGGSSGAFVTADGELRELSLAMPLPTSGWRSLELEDGVDRQRALPAGRGRAFGPHHVHQVGNPSASRHAVSVHVYHPPLPRLRRYSRDGDVLSVAVVETQEDW
ncbi:cysteine dioxygenase [Streptacidiphilus pinicola]|uniref:Cysteine dioxygenase n=1 Tax=Streptacidiphilus pinicola TaxID=2219663 RepID=A0A2X0IMD4_9ACTN|nr:cysteine dioxygenase [Streptacidiphilus pinicola]RAG84713.1 cysteine dioxygenase [Streptacidiphilus pinicola]